MCVYVYLCRTEATYYLCVRDDHYDDDREYILLTWLGLLYRTSSSSKMMFGDGSSTSTDDDGWSWTLDDAWIDGWMTVNTRSLHYEAAQSSTEAVRVCVGEGEPWLTYTSWYLVLTHVYNITCTLRRIAWCCCTMWCVLLLLLVVYIYLYGWLAGANTGAYSLPATV